MKRWFLITVMLTIGCASHKVAVNYSFSYPEVKDKIRYASKGSLWVDNYAFYADRKAHKVGDIVTIIVKERAKSSDTGKTETSKSSQASATLTALLGLKDDIGKILGMTDPTTPLGFQSTLSYKGAGVVQQESSLETKITAVVTRVYPNGNLMIEGKREIVINGEKKIIGIRGIVRQSDITPDNTISSEYIANAEIIYYGKGVVSGAQSPGFITKLLNWIWPF